MRRGTTLFVAFAIVACASDDFPGTQQVSSPSAGADANGTWTISWGPLTGRNTYTDTTSSGGVVTITPGVVRDTCVVSGTLTLTQAQGVTYVTGPWAFTSGYCIQADSTKGTRDSLDYTAITDAIAGSIAHANLGSGRFTFSLETQDRRFQYGLVEGTTMAGSVQWSLRMPARPTKSRGTVRGGFTATKP